MNVVQTVVSQLVPELQKDVFDLKKKKTTSEKKLLFQCVSVRKINSNWKFLLLQLKLTANFLFLIQKFQKTNKNGEKKH